MASYSPKITEEKEGVSPGLGVILLSLSLPPSLPPSPPLSQNNRNKLARWTCQALLAGVDYLKVT